MRIERPWLLIADDDLTFRESLQWVLESEGYQTLVASSGDEAVSLAKDRDLHVLILDFHMPRLTGLEAFRIVRKLRGPVPCILMSAELDASTVEEARRESVFEILTKPFSLRQLSHLVREALHRNYSFDG